MSPDSGALAADVVAEPLAGDARLINRELSWLAFNERVFEEASNPAHSLADGPRMREALAALDFLFQRWKWTNDLKMSKHDVKRRKLTQAQVTALNSVLEQLRAKASDLGVSPGVLCNRKDAEKLVAVERDLQVLSGWRLECIGNALLELKHCARKNLMSACELPELVSILTG